MRRPALTASAVLIGALALAGTLPWAGEALAPQKPEPVRGRNVAVGQLRPGAIPEGVTLPPRRSGAPLGRAEGTQDGDAAGAAVVMPGSPSADDAGAEPAAADTIVLDAGMEFNLLGAVGTRSGGAGREVPSVVARTSADGTTWSEWTTLTLEVAGGDVSGRRLVAEPCWVGTGRYAQFVTHGSVKDLELSFVNSLGQSSVADRIAGVVGGVVAAVQGLWNSDTAHAAASKPAIVTRAQWGADESLRRDDPDYAPVKMAFVHHTVSGNSYSRSQSPAVVRAIYHYHVKGAGYDDIGYNFLIDRFGTIYEGRYGGIKEGVIGAQTYGFNTGSTGVALIGTYTSASPPSAATTALKKLLAWKLDLHHVDPTSTAKMLCRATDRYTAGQTVKLPAISGHRNANYTACPGSALYGKLPGVRTAVAKRGLPKIYSPSASRALFSPDGDGRADTTTFRFSASETLGWSLQIKAADGAVVRRFSGSGRSVSRTWDGRDGGGALVPDGPYTAVVAGKSSRGTARPAEMVVASVTQPANVTLTLSAGEVAPGATVTYSGTVTTAAGAPASGTVRVQKRRAGTSSWADWRSDRLAADGSYAVDVAMTTADRQWEFRARMPATASHATGYSPLRTLRVLPPAPWEVTLDLSAGEVAPGATVTYSGTVTTAAGAPASGTVRVQKRRAGTSSWADWRSDRLAADGSYAVDVAMTTADRQWEFRARMPPTASHATGYSSTQTLTVGSASVGESWSESTLFNIEGRGWGHGIGMSQYGAYGYARHGWSYKRILRHYYTGVSFGKTPNRTVRVLLASGQQEVRVSSGSAYKARAGSRKVGISAGMIATVAWAGSGYRLTAGGRSWVFADPVTFERGSQSLRLYNRNDNGWPSGSGGVRYRGKLRVVRSGSTLQIVNHVSLESYLRGVVPRESPSSWPQAALRAQAVAARSYAVRDISSGGSYDLRCTTASQVYNGYDGEAASTTTAVVATAGVVPTYGGKPIVAYYFSTSGGRTENIENVWGGSPVPYLKSVSDPYDDASPHHIWKDAPYRYSQAAMAKKLGSLSAGVLQAFHVTKRGKSPRVVSASLIGADGVRAASGWTLRGKLGLRDTWFRVRSLSISPTAGDRATIVYGEALTLQGRTYPAIADGGRLTLHYYRDGVWRTTKVPVSQTHKRRFTYTLGGSARSGSYTTYSFRARPSRTTTYYFSYGKSRSPKMTLGVRPALTIAADRATAQSGDTVTFTGTVLPVRKAGATVELRRLSGESWIPVAEGTVAADGLYEIPWTAASGTWSFKTRVAAGDQMLANSSPVVSVSVE